MLARVCRVWNIDCDCLGEMPLPNLSDAMKRAPFDKHPVGGWKFVLERLTVSEAQKETADALREKILAATKGRGGGLSAGAGTALKLPATTGALLTTSDAVMNLPLITPSRAYLPSPGLFEGLRGDEMEGSDSDSDGDEGRRLGGRLEESLASATLNAGKSSKSGKSGKGGGASVAVSFAEPSPKVRAMHTICYDLHLVVASTQLCAVLIN